MRIPTAAEIAAARSPAGGWTKAQLAEWGVSWPPPKGWRQALVVSGDAQDGPKVVARVRQSGRWVR